MPRCTANWQACCGMQRRKLAARSPPAHLRLSQPMMAVAARHRSSVRAGSKAPVWTNAAAALTYTAWQTGRHR